jgi:hypothetical protein
VKTLFQTLVCLWLLVNDHALPIAPDQAAEFFCAVHWTNDPTCLLVYRSTNAVHWQLFAVKTDYRTNVVMRLVR